MTLEDVNSTISTSGSERCSDLRKTLVHVLKKAEADKRLTCGMMPTLKALEVDPTNALFCIIPQARKYDSAFHIQHVLLEAFCYEQDIHIVKVDNADKLRGLISFLKPSKPKELVDVSCVLVSKKLSATDELLLSEAEKRLQSFCNDAHSVPNPPVIKLPNL